MIRYILIVCLLFIGIFFSKAQDKPVVSVPPKIALKPTEIVLKDYKERFYTTQISVLNKGGETLVLNSVTGSCKCATASIQNSTIEPLSSGKIVLNVNTDGFYEEKNTVEYIILSNASNSSISIRITFEKSDIEKTRPKQE